MDFEQSAVSNDFLVWSIATEYLPQEEVYHTLKGHLNHEILHEMVQSFLKQLHNIDESINIMPQGDQSIKDLFDAALKKARASLRDEIIHLCRVTQSRMDPYPYLATIITKPDYILEMSAKELVRLNSEIEQLNKNIIEDAVRKSKENNRLCLSVNGTCLTRIPKEVLNNPDHELYWSNLQILELRNNSLQNLPNDLPDKLKNLKNLNLSMNALMVVPECITKMARLRALNLSYNQLKNIPEEIANMPKLSSLDFSHNKLTQLSDAICHMPQLAHLNISDNKFFHVKLELIERFGKDCTDQFSPYERFRSAKNKWRQFNSSRLVTNAEKYFDAIHGDINKEDFLEGQDTLATMSMDELASSIYQGCANVMNFCFNRGIRRNAAEHIQIVVNPSEENNSNKRQSDSPESESKRLRK